jgi:CRISPR-associated protein Cmx8
MSEEPGPDGAPTRRAASPRQPKRTRGVDGTAQLRLSWSVHELPSSQHRAGLAGLALCVAFLKRKSDRKGVCDIVSIDERGLTLVVDRPGMQSLFDDVYDAPTEEASSKAKWAGTEPKRIDEVEVKDDKTGKTKNEKRFIYDRVVPRGALVDEWDGTASGAP